MKIDIKKIKEMRNEGKSLPVIGKYFGVSKSLISLVCQSFGNRGVKMTKNTSKIYPLLFELKKEYVDNKLSLQKIALKYDVNNVTLGMVFKREKIELRTNNETRYYLRKLGLYKPCNLKGINNPNWRGGKSRIKYHGYTEEEYLNWRNQVFARDNWTCRECGVRNYLNGHHVIPTRLDKSKILDVSNGITLCEQCHEKTYNIELEYAEKYLALIQNTAKAGV